MWGFGTCVEGRWVQHKKETVLLGSLLDQIGIDLELSTLSFGLLPIYLETPMVFRFWF